MIEGLPARFHWLPKKAKTKFQFRIVKDVVLPVSGTGMRVGS